MAPPISVQLYSLRDSMAKDFDGVVRKVAEIGYAGVETAGFNGSSPKAAAKLFSDLGLKVSSAHSGLPLGDRKNEVLDNMALLDCKYLVYAHYPPEKFKSVDSIKQICNELNEANEVAQANGLTLFYHNHWWEYEIRLDGGVAYKVMVDNLAPTINLELDTYWIKTGGQDPAAIVREFGVRAPLLHIKDGPATTDGDMLAVGEGVMDWQAVVDASAGAAEWMIVELDRCATDMLEAVAKSYTYLTSKGYAHGSKG